MKGRTGLSIALLFVAAAIRTSGFVDDKNNPETPLDVYEWSVWVANPAQTTINTTRIYKSAMPGSVGTSRPTLEEKERTIKFAVAPISVVQFFGDACKDVDVDLRAKKGTFLSHWPHSAERAGRLQWYKSDLSAGPPAGIPQSYLTENHWLNKLRDKEKALYLKHESHYERFIAYDTEVVAPVPLKIRGGPDEYTLQNLTGRRLVDVAVIAPTDSGYRVGWLDELPTAAPETTPTRAADKDRKGRRGQEGRGAGSKKEESQEKKDDAKKTPEQKAQAVFDEAEAAGKEKKKAEEELPPLPAEGDANVKARVDQVLNRPIVMNVDNAPRREVIGMIAGQARFRYELDDKGIAKAEIDMNQGVTVKSPNIAPRDALAEVLGGAGPELPRHRGRQALHHDRRPARRGHEQEGPGDRGPAGEADHVAAAPGLRPDPRRHDPRHDDPAAGRPGPARGPGEVPARPVRPVALRAEGADRAGAPLAAGDRRGGDAGRLPAAEEAGPHGDDGRPRRRPAPPGPGPRHGAAARQQVLPGPANRPKPSSSRWAPSPSPCWRTPSPTRISRSSTAPSGCCSSSEGPCREARESGELSNIPIFPGDPEGREEYRDRDGAEEHLQDLGTSPAPLGDPHHLGNVGDHVKDQGGRNAEDRTQEKGDAQEPEPSPSSPGIPALDLGRDTAEPRDVRAPSGEQFGGIRGMLIVRRRFGSPPMEVSGRIDRARAPIAARWPLGPMGRHPRKGTTVQLLQDLVVRGAKLNEGKRFPAAIGMCGQGLRAKRLFDLIVRTSSRHTQGAVRVHGAIVAWSRHSLPGSLKENPRARCVRRLSRGNAETHQPDYHGPRSRWQAARVEDTASSTDADICRAQRLLLKLGEAIP